MIILGIDPGLAIVGWGVLEYNGSHFRPLGYGSILTPSTMSTEERLVEIYRAMGQIIERYHPDSMAVEELFWNTNQTTGIRVSEARGVILLAGAQKGLPIFEYTPLQVKQSVVGYGRAEKNQVMVMVKTLLKLGPELKLDDTADALAIAICHAHTRGSLVQDFYNQKKKKLL